MIYKVLASDTCGVADIGIDKSALIYASTAYVSLLGVWKPPMSDEGDADYVDHESDPEETILKDSDAEKI